MSRFSKLFSNFFSSDYEDDNLGNTTDEEMEIAERRAKRKAQRLREKEIMLQRNRERDDRMCKTIEVDTDKIPPSQQLKDLKECNVFNDSSQASDYEEDDYDEDDYTEDDYEDEIEDIGDNDYENSKDEVEIQPMGFEQICDGLAACTNGTSALSASDWEEVVDLSFEYNYITKDNYLYLREIFKRARRGK